MFLSPAVRKRKILPLEGLPADTYNFLSSWLSASSPRTLKVTETDQWELAVRPCIDSPSIVEKAGEGLIGQDLHKWKYRKKRLQPQWGNPIWKGLGYLLENLN